VACLEGLTRTQLNRTLNSTSNALRSLQRAEMHRQLWQRQLCLHAPSLSSPQVCERFLFAQLSLMCVVYVSQAVWQSQAKGSPFMLMTAVALLQVSPRSPLVSRGPWAGLTAQQHTRKVRVALLRPGRSMDVRREKLLDHAAWLPSMQVHDGCVHNSSSSGFHLCRCMMALLCAQQQQCFVSQLLTQSYGSTKMRAPKFAQKTKANW
jgi:hypothetical protein